MRAIFTGASKDQINWGSNDDPEGYLVIGETYEIERVEEHTRHTKYWIDGRKYNSVSFEEVI